MVKSKFSFYTYSTFFFIIAFSLSSVFLISRFYTDTKAHADKLSSYVVATTIILPLSILFFYIMAKRSFVIRISQQAIQLNSFFKKLVIQFPEIDSINLFAKKDLYWTTGSTTIVICINLQNGKKIIIADPLYTNIYTIKQYLYENFKEKIVPFRIKNSYTTIKMSLETDSEKFSGSFVNIRSIAFFSIVIIFGVMILKSGGFQWSHLGFIFMIIVSFFGFGLQLNYFVVSNQRLIVKNHFLFWTNRVYDINDIIEVDFESPYRRSDALRITTNNFKSRLFSGGSLRNKHWIALKEKLIQLNVYFVT